MELVIQRRQNEFDGYVLEPHGASLGQAVRTRDISIPSYREEMRRIGVVQLTGDNGNTSVRGLATTPPTLEQCEMVLNVLDARRPEAIEAIRATIAEEKLEMKDAALGRDERAYMRLRVKGMERTIELMEAEAEITAEDLHYFFRAEHIALRGKFVPPELRETLSVLNEEREFARA